MGKQKIKIGKIKLLGNENNEKHLKLNKYQNSLIKY